MTLERAFRIAGTIILVAVVVSAFTQTWGRGDWGQMILAVFVAMAFFAAADERKEGGR